MSSSPSDPASSGETGRDGDGAGGSQYTASGGERCSSRVLDGSCDGLEASCGARTRISEARS